MNMTWNKLADCGIKCYTRNYSNLAKSNPRWICVCIKCFLILVGVYVDDLLVKWEKTFEIKNSAALRRSSMEQSLKRQTVITRGRNRWWLKSWFSSMKNAKQVSTPVANVVATAGNFNRRCEEIPYCSRCVVMDYALHSPWCASGERSRTTTRIPKRSRLLRRG